jgi:hypothetical protein
MAALLVVEIGQVVEALRDVWMVRSQRLFPDRQRALVERPRFGVTALVIVEMAKLLRLIATSGWPVPAPVLGSPARAREAAALRRRGLGHGAEAPAG